MAREGKARNESRDERRLVSADDIDETIEKMVVVAARTYNAQHEFSAMRSALGDAAALCDRLASDRLEAGRIKGGYVKKAARKDAELLRTAGDVIWSMREQFTTERRASAQQQRAALQSAEPTP
jgi:hypothetical protein